MKKFSVIFALATITASTSSFALPNQAFDTDGFERVTQYAHGPIATSIITSEFAHKLNVYLHPRNVGDFCSYGNIYAQTTGEHIVHADISRVPAQVVIQQATADIPEQYLTQNKQLRVSCTTVQGEDYDVLVNIPGAPIIEWEVDVEPRGEFVHRPNTYGYHSAYKVNSHLRINNQSNDGRCQTLSNRGIELGLFHNKNSKGPFHSDVFSTLKTIDNTQAGQPVLYQMIECQNAAGKTLAIKVFTLTNPTDIYIVEEDLIVK
ncbi:hypothetical protein PSECIP111951_00192 [Pseudoalteromonas holothuriae]|uniref:Uncharacterized protein n=1 Tax=Pseudoalteromonas holothuriae TaxID=2963714 RepID=A0A9W4QTD6_9GAMM|nr:MULTISPECIES: hypothetical protein [unclassified Pseudoalteromonas]CAH9050438.1 hypothetical protein PSECIP111951_00192 [Pseudoalteromonas sp. CIP111951]CAH9052246.1 hypothetical protein PSECIP111854_00928 [Pseudoalteromonas sp. CIP111854]